MKNKVNTQNIIIIFLLLVVIALLVEPKLNTNIISEISDEILTDSTSIDDSLIVKKLLLEKGNTEKEIETFGGGGAELNVKGEIGRYQLQTIDGSVATSENSYSIKIYGTIVVLDTKTGDVTSLYNPNNIDNKNGRQLRKIQMAPNFK